MADGDNQDPNANGNNTNVVDPTSQQPVETKSPLDMMTQQDIDKQKIQDELNAAVKRGDRVRVEELVDRGADVNAPGQNGLTAMGNAVENNDSGMSREFLQQKANGNIAFDPTADTNLTGGTFVDPTTVTPVSSTPVDPSTGTPVDPATGQANPNAPGTDVTTGANVADAVAQGVTAEEAAANGNFALAAQLEAQEDLAQEALEQNDAASTDLSDGDMSYASTVAQSQGGYYEDPYEDYYDGDGFGYDPYDPYDDPYEASGYGDDPYGDPYGDDNYYQADSYDPYASQYDSTYAFNDPAFGANDPTLGTGSSTLGFGNTSLGLGNTSLGLGNSTLDFADPSLAGPTSFSSLGTPSGSSTSSFFNFQPMSYDAAANDTSTLVTLPETQSFLASNGPSSNFFDFSSPTTSAGQTVWNTQFFDPAALDVTTPTAAPAQTATIAPTNPYYKPAAGATAMSMG